MCFKFVGSEEAFGLTCGICHHSVHSFDTSEYGGGESLGPACDPLIHEIMVGGSIISSAVCGNSLCNDQILRPEESTLLSSPENLHFRKELLGRAKKAFPNEEIVFCEQIVGRILSSGRMVVPDLVEEESFSAETQPEVPVLV